MYLFYYLYDGLMVGFSTEINVFELNMFTFFILNTWTNFRKK